MKNSTWLDACDQLLYIKTKKLSIDFSLCVGFSF